MRSLRLGEIAPDFEAETTEGRIRFHEWIGESWAVLFSHPKNYTPVCTTELGYMAKIKPEFDRRSVKIIGLSVDPVDQHAGWAADIAATQGIAPNYPLIGDADFTVAKLYDMLPANTSGDPGQRSAADNQTVRNVFVIGPDKRIKLILVYPMTTGRNFDEVLRVIDSLQLTNNHKVATPVNWRPGEDVIIAGTVSDDEARRTYPNGFRAPRPYLRIVPQAATRSQPAVRPAQRRPPRNPNLHQSGRQVFVQAGFATRGHGWRAEAGTSTSVTGRGQYTVPGRPWQLHQRHQAQWKPRRNGDYRHGPRAGSAAAARASTTTRCCTNSATATTKSLASPTAGSYAQPRCELSARPRAANRAPPGLQRIGKRPECVGPHADPPCKGPRSRQTAARARKQDDNNESRGGVRSKKIHS